MAHAAPTAEQIETASRRRQELWLSGDPDPYEVIRLTRLLDSLFEGRRHERARSRYGDREQIVRRARVEVELERLQQQAA